MTDSDLSPEARIERRKLDPGKDWSAFPAYDAAKNGLRDYWYPVLWARQLKRRPIGVRICGEKIVLQRDQEGKVRALHDKLPLSRLDL